LKQIKEQTVKKLELLDGGRRHQKVGKTSFDIILILGVVHGNQKDNQKAKGTTEKLGELFAIREDVTDKLARFLPHLREKH